MPSSCGLAWQISRTKCVRNETFACTPVRLFGQLLPELFTLTTVNCRAWFSCGETVVQCGDWQQPNGRCQCGNHREVGDVATFLAPFVQGSYSEQLYGVPGAVDLEAVDLVHLDLLPTHGLKAIGAVGACRVDGSRDRPFFWNGLPRDSVWVHRPLPATARANHSWVEVVHCAVVNASNLAPYHRALWAYAATGSGVAMNVGRTLVAWNYHHAIKLLSHEFAETRASFDTIQVVNHEELHVTREVRNEIIFLNAGHDTWTFEDVARRKPGALRCGREGHTVPCGPHHLHRFSRALCEPERAPYDRPQVPGFYGVREERCITRDPALGHP